MVKKAYYKYIKKSSKNNAIIAVAETLHEDKTLMVPLTKKIHKKTGALPGDIIEIRYNEKRVMATVIEGYEEDIDKDYIRLDKSSREQLGITLGECVNISKLKVSNATQILLEPSKGISGITTMPIDWQGYFRDTLKNKGVVEGSTVNVKVLGIGMEFNVVRILPEELGRVTDETNFEFASEKQAS